LLAKERVIERSNDRVSQYTSGVDAPDSYRDALAVWTHPGLLRQLADARPSLSQADKEGKIKKFPYSMTLPYRTIIEVFIP